MAFESSERAYIIDPSAICSEPTIIVVQASFVIAILVCEGLQQKVFHYFIAGIVGMYGVVGICRVDLVTVGAEQCIVVVDVCNAVTCAVFL